VAKYFILPQAVGETSLSKGQIHVELHIHMHQEEALPSDDNDDDPTYTWTQFVNLLRPWEDDYQNEAMEEEAYQDMLKAYVFPPPNMRELLTKPSTNTSPCIASPLPENQKVFSTKRFKNMRRQGVGNVIHDIGVPKNSLGTQRYFGLTCIFSVVLFWMLVLYT